MLTVFSDLHCPWAYVFSIRLRRARAGIGRPPVAWRCWPLELVNERGTPWETLSQEIPVLTQLERPAAPGHRRLVDRGPGPAQADGEHIGPRAVEVGEDGQHARLLTRGT